MRNALLLVILLLSFLPLNAKAQPRTLVGECQEFQSGKIYGIFSDYFVQEKFNNFNSAYGYRDQSGQALMRLPSANPMNAIWLTWDNRVVLINNFGWRNIGQCALNQNFINFNKISTFGFPNQYASMRVETYSNNGTPQFNNFSVPRSLVNEDIEYIKPTHVSLNMAQSCAQFIEDKNRFLDCMAPQFLGDKEKKYYNCMRKQSSNEDLAMCMLMVNLGENEKSAINTAKNCFQRHGTNWNQYPLCVASNDSLFDEKTARALQCLQKSMERGQSFDYIGMGVCYAGPQVLSNMNQESLVAMQCAMSSGGDPLTFAGCTGGQLTALEIDKCFTNGIGGDGCFGKGNTIIAVGENVAREIGQHFGPNSEAVKAWRAVTTAPGPNHEAVRVVNNVVREMNTAGKNIEREVKKIVPKIKIKW